MNGLMIGFATVGIIVTLTGFMLAVVHVFHDLPAKIDQLKSRLDLLEERRK